MNILVTLDGSHLSEAILGTVAKMARPLGAHVELLRVGRPSKAQESRPSDSLRELLSVSAASGTPLRSPLPTAVLERPPETREQALARTEAELRDYLAGCARVLEGIDTTITVIIADDPASAIVERARRSHADLIAMATHGRAGINHLLAGSVCEHVIRSGVTPVLVLRP